MLVTKIVSPQEFVAELHIAATELYQQTRLFASVTLAQAALETGWLKFLPHDLITGRNSFNIYGVKGKGPAGSVRDFTQEFENGKYETVITEFAAYHNYQESMEVRAQLLLHDARYKAVLQAATPAAASNALYATGYATDPNYAKELIGIIQTYNLTQFDVLVPPVPKPLSYQVVVGSFDTQAKANVAAANIMHQFGYHVTVEKA